MWKEEGNGGSAPLDQTEDEGQNGHDDEDEKEDLGDANGPCGNAAKAEDRRNQCDDHDFIVYRPQALQVPLPEQLNRAILGSRLHARSYALTSPTPPSAS